MTATAVRYARTEPGARYVVLLALALAAAPALAQQDNLGRLFTDSATRATLDRMREEGPVVAPVLAEPVAPEPVVPQELPDLTVSGVVVRSGGRSSAWVNGQLVNDGGATFEGVRVNAGRSGRSVELVLPAGGDGLLVRPGQRIEVRSGSVLESYEIAAEEGAPTVFEEETAATGREDPTEATARSLVDRTERTLDAIKALGELFGDVSGGEQP